MLLDRESPTIRSDIHRGLAWRYRSREVKSDFLRQTIRNLVESGRTRIILNFSEVNSMDSAGVGELAGAYKAVKSRGGELKFLNPTKKVHGILVITGLDKVFEVYTDEQAAIRSFSKTAHG